MSHKLTIEQMKSVANSRGGECLSLEYVDAKTKLQWKCNKSHMWYAKPSDVKNKHSWCPYCSRNLKNSIENARDIAEKRGGRCLSLIYKEKR